MSFSIFIDSDNGMGSSRGDIDDGFAIAALLMQRDFPISCLASVGGNTSAQKARFNNEQLAQLLRFEGPCVAGADPGFRGSTDSSRLLSKTSRVRIAALGPLTNLAQSLTDGWKPPQVEVVGIGSNFTSKGKYPPVWPYEFNLTKDKDAFRTVYESHFKIVLAPLDSALKMQVPAEWIKQLPAPYRTYFWNHSKRWYQRARWLKWKTTVPLWDLVAAIYLLQPGLFNVQPYPTTLHGNGWLEYGKGKRIVWVIQDFDPASVWKFFVTLFPSVG